VAIPLNQQRQLLWKDGGKQGSFCAVRAAVACRALADPPGKSQQGKIMLEILIIWLGAGATVGWLASQIMPIGGFGTQGDIIVGVVGGLIGALLLPQLGILLGGGYLGHIINPVIGAVVAVFASRQLKTSPGK
jgi:uncharacterized membrane protein YeaQ/YmgE (transglycosylase-associated protein family)